MSGNVWIACGAVLASAAVAAGAMGTHVLKETVKLEPAGSGNVRNRRPLPDVPCPGIDRRGTARASRQPHWLLTAAGVAFLLGIVLFSGGIYAWLATAQKPFIMVVPIGGIGLDRRLAAAGRRRDCQRSKKGISPALLRGEPRRRLTLVRMRDVKRPRALQAPWPAACGRRAAAA